ncbi:acetyl-CoA C-acetyltransferase [Streptosporangium becharense]|uniref:Acetyl-CoA C-acetyltransferase n=1 Tax=Streptosporangium becharense TaxID=1816182 RepID=A0A7W9IC16_9ACTN|nr:acetyl-CoA acetyltransferase [Streptosporangium becharense]MBB2910739.1 acetyl-CoA C-acetyltransferase [Streptosporangium becharense]MBB5817434.1 acetyl-CoA C-acetyltransferase [Streptosporangium becharense]
MTFHDIDSRTPVLVGVGQASERIGEPGYRRLSPVELAAAAAREAIADTGADAAAVAAAVDTVAGVRQFEISTPVARAPLGKSTNYPRSVAARVGARPRRAVLEVAGGQAPQHLVNEFAATIAAGSAQAVLLFGSEAISTVRHFAKAEDRPDFGETVEGDLEDRGYGLKGMASRLHTAHGLTDAPSQYALFDNARRARLKQSRQEYAAGMGALFAPFTKVAAANPHAAAPVERSAGELVTPTPGNRVIADPYLRYLVAREKVNQGAAVLLTSVATARRLGVPEERWVFLHGHADLRERALLERADLSSGPASVMAVRHALDVAALGVDDLDFIDLYSCFPIAVSNICDGLGLTGDDPRGLTVTGGLPFFGGAGNNYSMHAIAEVVQRLRARPGAYGLVGANGGTLSKYSVGVYSTTPAEWRPDGSAALQAEIDAWPAVEQAVHADGWATIETYTVKHRRDGGRTGIVIGRLEADGRRFLATAADGDEEMLDLLGDGEPVGRRVYARSFGFGNRVSGSDTRMDELFPPRPAVLRDDYEHVLVRRDGHILEITINRPESRNSLHPPANDELDEVFDAFFADPGLWVAILTGAGDKAFSAGDDLLYSASGRSMWIPRNGFAGLTGRREMRKPVIAAVNGFAMGGGFEAVLACHLVVADATARFALSEAKVGLVAGAGGLVRLPREIPPKLATEMILTGRRLHAAEALEHGLVNRVTGAGKALEGARELAWEILESSPTSVRASLQIMEETRAIPDVMDAVTHPSEAVDDLLASEDLIEGLTAFAEKRPPRWRNR